MKRRFLLLPSLTLAALVLGAALVYPLVQGRLTAAAREFYGATDGSLHPFLAARVVGYRSFFWILLAAVVAWCVAIWAPAPRVKRREGAIPRRPPPYSVWIAEGVAFLAMATVSCLRPLRRRRRRTSRPARVFMRLRKPCVRFRLLRWG